MFKVQCLKISIHWNAIENGFIDSLDSIFHKPNWQYEFNIYCNGIYLLVK